MKVRKAVVLAAGLGTRLRPLTCVAPKPLLPIWGVPMLERLVDALCSWGVDDIVVNCHYLHEQIESWVAAKRGAGLRIATAYEPEILGTGGVLNPLRDWIGTDSFYLVNGDIVVEGFNGFEPSVEGSVETVGTCLMTEAGPRTIEADPNGYVTCWKSPDAGFPGTFTYCGLALLKPEILKYVEPTGFSTIVQAYERAMMDGKFMRGVTSPELLWTDAGTIPSYLELNRDGEDNAFADLPQLRAVDAKEVEFLGARGSDRCFFRADGNLVVIYDDAKRAENARYAGHAMWLKSKGVHVPSVLKDFPDIKTTVYSWAGCEHRMSLEEYVKVVEGLAVFNGLDSKGLELESAFGPDLWAWERNLFIEHCLGSRYRMECPKGVLEELGNVASLLEHEPKALVHRDFQSSNILWKNGDYTFIDFQGMRLGPAAYDLASLLYDPYAEKLTEGERRALTKLYGKCSGRPEIEKILPFAAVQRLIQCLGAYGRLASVGHPQFGKYVLPALENLLTAADEADLESLGALAEDLIARESHTHAQGTDHCHCHEEGGSCSCGHHHEHHEGCTCHHRQ